MGPDHQRKQADVRFALMELTFQWAADPKKKLTA